MFFRIAKQFPQIALMAIVGFLNYANASDSKSHSQYHNELKQYKFVAKSDARTAIQLAKKALPSVEASNSKVALANYNNALAELAILNSDNGQAIRYIAAANILSKGTTLFRERAISFQLSSKVFAQSKLLEKALSSLDSAIALANLSGDNLLRLQLETEKLSISNSVSTNNKKNFSFAANEYLSQAKLSEDTTHFLQALLHAANASLLSNKLSEESEKNFNEAIKLALRGNFIFHAAQISYHYANFLLKAGRLDEAKQVALRALDLSNRYATSYNEIKSSYELLGKIELASNNKEKSEEYFSKAVQVDAHVPADSALRRLDAILSNNIVEELKEKNKYLEQLQIKKEEAALQKTRVLIAIIIVAALLLISLSVLYLQKRKYAKKVTEANNTIQEQFSELVKLNKFLKQREKELLDAKELAETASLAKANFLSTMSHEIRTPMNSVVGLAQILIDENPKKEQLQYLGILKEQSVNLLNLINDILDFSKIEAGKLILEEIPFSLSALLKRTYQTFRIQAIKKDIDFLLELDPELPHFVKGDELRIGQVLNNLVSNAIKFTERGFVKIEAKVELLNKDSVRVFFAVSDSGVGIGPENQDKIFDMFTQEATFTTRKFGGTGLGLAISSKILDKMKSRIHLKSEAGMGSRFSFFLELPYAKDFEITSTDKDTRLNENFKEPLLESLISKEDLDENIASEKDGAENFVEKNQENSVTSTLTGNQNTNSKAGADIPPPAPNKTAKFQPFDDVRILAVDDNEFNIIVVKKFLEKWNVKVLVANGGEEAVKIATNPDSDLDLILMDLQMPEIDGFEATKRIKATPGFETLPVMALTASAMLEVQSQVFEVGMVGYVTKPFNPADLHQKITNLLDVSPRRIKRKKEEEAKSLGRNEEVILSFSKLDSISSNDYAYQEGMLRRCILEIQKLQQEFAGHLYEGDDLSYSKKLAALKTIYQMFALSNEYALLEKGVLMIKEGKNKGIELERYIKEVSFMLSSILAQLHRRKDEISKPAEV